MASIELDSHAQGKLVALEGDVETISTQLSLLPPSQKILVLPSLLDLLQDRDNDVPFDARSFVKSIHDIFTQRTEEARSFLTQNTNGQPRLVFTNGGSVGARAICIARIAENLSNGDIEDAEGIFDDIVKNGVAGLTLAEAIVEKGSNPEVDETEDGDSKEVDEDPTMRAMKAAETLDHVAGSLETGAVDTSAVAIHGDATIVETEPPVTETNENDFSEEQVKQETTEESKSRSSRRSKVPVQELIFTAPKGEEIRRTVITLPKKSSVWSRRSTISTQVPELSSFPTRPYYADVTWELQSDDEAMDDFDVPSPGDDTFPSTPVVVYGEACLVDIHSTEPEIPLRRVKSADRLNVKLLQTSNGPSLARSLKQSTSHYQLRTKPLATEQPIATDGYFQTLPRTTFVRASQTTIKKSPTTSAAASLSSLSLKEPARVFVDRGTDADEIVPSMQAEVAAGSSLDKTGPFEPVFPLVEDLVINLTMKGSDRLFEKALTGYKDGIYPLMYTANEINHEKLAGEDQLTSETIRPISDMTVETDDIGYSRRHTYDPYAYHPESKIQWPLPNSMGGIDRGVQMQPPTPCMTPPPSDRMEKFVDFSPGAATSAIDLQNSLRQIFNTHFPSNEGYTQHFYAAPSEMERLWKPVFRTDDSSSVSEEGRTVDQILALGCEKGVDKDFFAQISGQVEKLGCKRNGLNRSGKLDIRYLISNIILSLPQLSADHLDPVRLAVLLIPQLEAYLASNLAVRFLILHYTPDHLAVVLALQSLLGNDLLKVAGILDTLASDPPSFSRPRTPQLNPLSNEATMMRPSSRRNHVLTLKQQLLSAADPTLSNKESKLQISNHSNLAPSFSKANYLIPSTATDTEITTFLSAIWKALMEKSSFYTPDPDLKSSTNSSPTPLSPRVSTPKPPTSSHGTSAANFREQRERERAMHAGEVSYPPSSFKPPKSTHSAANDKASKLLGQDRPGNKYAPSIASSVRTTASERGRREDRAWENFYIAEEDSEDDDFDKMILGRGYAKIVPEVKKPGGKRPTKKALKWLGLA